MPVLARKPLGTAMPKAPVAWSRSPSVAPASTRTVPFSGSTVVLRSCERSTTSASFHTPSPPALWPPLRTETVTSYSRANRTQAITSATSRQRAIAAGRLSIMPL